MARLFMTVIVSALALLPHGAVAEEARKPLMRKAMATLSTPESLPHGALPEEAPKPLMRLAKAKSQTMGIESVGDNTMHTEQRLVSIRSKKEDTDGADDVGAEDKGAKHGPQDIAPVLQRAQVNSTCEHNTWEAMVRLRRCTSHIKNNENSLIHEIF